jgi:hypothetical protein
MKKPGFPGPFLTLSPCVFLYVSGYLTDSQLLSDVDIALEVAPTGLSYVVVARSGLQLHRGRLYS